jgi:hypothetical protein
VPADQPVRHPLRDAGQPLGRPEGADDDRAHAPGAVTYEINPGASGEKVGLISWTVGPNDLRKKSSAGEFPIKIEMDVPAGTKPYLRWSNGRDASCRALVDGQDVTISVTFLRESGLYECGAGSQP